ncbi:uncharacterized protein [Blastocystis hominis]|uniref:Ribosomal protein L22 n=1 Tax=Blastocystis hominis TaxID=12968 RepID=D8M9C2_BLAHO|nr:uncharacterized protein [Blastocystis hominis]CBK24661.2 unnamed protein product [Blastocystis hominis]|eukprot:XP_012898709.1 uncharacterized protein [Blastocystis hominis]
MTPADTKKSCQARGSYLTVHFKNAHEVGAAIKNMSLLKAEKYLNDVIAHKQAVAFTRFNGGVGRHAQAHSIKAPGDQCRWPKAACKFFLVLLNNLKANGEAKGLNVENLRISHVQVNQAPVMRRRTYRAHGRVCPYLRHPAHIEMMCTEEDSAVKKATSKPTHKRLTRRQLAYRKLVHQKLAEKKKEEEQKA